MPINADSETRRFFISPHFTVKFVRPEDWLEYNGHEYKYLPDASLTHLESQRKCTEMGGLLVSLNTKEEETFITENILGEAPVSAYIGGVHDEAGRLSVFAYAVIAPKFTQFNLLYTAKLHSRFSQQFRGKSCQSICMSI